MNFKIFTGLFLLLILCSFVSALPIPHSIRGTVYDLDGITHARMETTFEVVNLENGYTARGIIGKGSQTGVYSASINGFDGDRLTILFRNKYHNSSINITLSGVMTNVNEIINDSFPQNSPHVFSNLTNDRTLYNGQYSYNINATDIEDFDLEYLLILGPSGMTIDHNSGQINWAANILGYHNIFLIVRDTDLLSANYSFSLEVYQDSSGRSSSSSSSSSSPPTSGSSSPYSLPIDNTDISIEESSSDIDEKDEPVEQAPGDFEIYTTSKSDSKQSESTIIESKDGIINTLISLFETKDEYSKHIIYGIIKKDNMLSKRFSKISISESTLVSIEDEFGNVNNFHASSLFGFEYFFKVINGIPNSEYYVTAKNGLIFGDAKGLFSGFFNSITVNLDKTSYSDRPRYTINNIEYYFERPFSFLESPDKLVYSYLIDLSSFENQNVSFEVSKDWLLDYNLDVSSLILSVYSAGQYFEVDTSLVSIDEEKYVFTSAKNDLLQQLYVVTIKDSVYDKIILDYVIHNSSVSYESATSVDPFVINGVAFISDEVQFPRSSNYSISNNDRNSSVSGITGLVANDGAFSVIIEGQRNDEIYVEVFNETLHVSKIFNLTGDMNLVLKP